MSDVSILLLEDSPLDAELTLARLEKGGMGDRVRRVQSRAEFLAALEESSYDVILADFALPDFDGLSALAIVRERYPDVPFIVVSGMLGEDVAVETLQRGATDYVLKQRLDRLVPAVRRALSEARARIEQRRAEAALRASEERMRFALAAGRMCTMDIDVATEAVTWSPGAQHLLDLPESAFASSITGFVSHVHPEDQGRFLEAIRRASGELAEYNVEFRVVRADGSLGWVQSSGRRLDDGTGVVRVVGVCIETTERRRAEEHLRQVQRIEAIGRLAGGMAHETNNQMAVVLGFADFVLRRHDLAAPVRADVEQIRIAAERTASITRQLLAFSRRQAVQPQTLDVNELVRGFAPVLRRSLGERTNLELELHGTRAVRIDRGQLEQVLLNLVLNAADAMSSGGRLTIETADAALTWAYAVHKPGITIRPGSYLLLVVTDDGHGMDRETLGRVFEPFFTTKEVGKGTGLGLAAVYGIVKHAGGYIWAYSEPGLGTSFKVYLPAETADAGSHDGASDGVNVRGGTETVLVVEDEASVRAMTKRALEIVGYRVLEATNGVEALDLLRNPVSRVQLVVSDVIMPQLDGRELTEQLKRLDASPPVLYMSGFTDDDVIRRGLLDPAAPFIQKPFSPEMLAIKVRDVLDAQRAPHRVGGAAPSGPDDAGVTNSAIQG